MEHKKLAIGVLMILLAAAIAGVFVSALDANSARNIAPAGPGGLTGMDLSSVPASPEQGPPYVAPTHSQGVQGLAVVVPVWQQVNSNGFGDLDAGEVSAVEAFNGYLYAGTHNPIDPEPLYDGAGIFRSPDGVTWTSVILPGFGNTHDIAPPAILDLTVFKTQLYASTGRGNASQIWRTLNGTIWAPMDVTGFSDPDNVAITTLAEYGGKIYAGVTNDVNGAQIWSSFNGDNNSWTKVAPTAPGTVAAGVSGFAVYSDTLYAAVEFESDSPAQIWRSYGGAWTTIVSDGFGDSNTTSTGGMAVFAGYLYVGAGNTSSGAQLWRTNDETTWGQVITPAFGDSNNKKVETVYVFQNQLYVSVKNTLTGIEIWRSSNGTQWEQANQDGFGDSNNTGSNYSNATAEFLGQLYVGTSNVVDGGEVWRMKQPFDVNLSPGSALAGQPGETVTYTLQITNTGSVLDTFDLSTLDNSWPTNLSTSSVVLAAGASTTFQAWVDIPGGAAVYDDDSVSVKATSQGDNSKYDTAVLTTSVPPIYGVNLPTNDNLIGVAGETVTYTVPITNTGNVADTFDLGSTDNVWPTTLSHVSIVVDAGKSSTFTVTVDIPAGASIFDSDSASIRATSQHDGSKRDTVVLTTSLLDLPFKTYLPAIWSK